MKRFGPRRHQRMEFAERAACIPHPQEVRDASRLQDTCKQRDEQESADTAPSIMIQV